MEMINEDMGSISIELERELIGEISENDCFFNQDCSPED